MNPDVLLRRVRDWDEFSHAVSTLPDTKRMGDCFERLVQVFLTIDPKYRTLLRCVWRLSETPDRVLRKLGIPRDDNGVDLIAETVTGEYWGVQAKFRSNIEGAHTWTELASFAGLVGFVSNKFAFALVASTKENAPRLMRNVARAGFILSRTWLSLGPEFFCRVREYLGPPPRRALVPLEPKPHQSAAVEAGALTLQTETRAKIVMACGTGKTLVGYLVARALAARGVLVVVPSLALIAQTYETWLRETCARGERASWVLVCCEQPGGRTELDAPILRAQELGVPTTDAEHLVEWLRSKRSDQRIVFTTLASGPVIAAAAREANFEFDFAVFDEAHRTTGRSGKQSSHLLFDANIRIRRRLFLTATERHYTGDRDDVASMDDTSLYGRTAYHLSVAAALRIRPRVLVDYSVVTMAIEDEEIRQLVDGAASVSFENEDTIRDASTIAAAAAVRRAMATLGARHVITYHRSIASAQDFARLLQHVMPKSPPVEVVHVSSEQSASTRARILRDFAVATRAIVTNARALTEGVDIPEVDLVCFVDARRGVIDIVQAVGRALRLSRSKRRGIVLLPLVVDGRSASLAEEALDTQWEDAVWILRCLASIDERVIDEFSTLVAGKVLRHRSVVDFSHSDASIVDSEEFARAILLRCWDRLERLAPILEFNEARDVARTLVCGSAKAYRELGRTRLRALGLLTNPECHYAASWTDWADYLGNTQHAQNVGRTSRSFLRFEEARRIIHEHSFRSLAAFRAWARSNRDSRIPINPHLTYPDEYRGRRDWLGLPDAMRGEWLPYARAVAFTRSLGLTTRREWELYRQGRNSAPRPRLPARIPATPEQVYRNVGWVSWTDWLVGDTRSMLEQLEVLDRDDRELERAIGLGHGFLIRARLGRTESSGRGQSPRCWAAIAAFLRTRRGA